jgi:hypothetical protein
MPPFAKKGESMSEFNKPSEHDSYNHIESMNRVKKAFDEEMQMRAKTQQQVYDELRNDILEQVALDIEKMTGFGKDTISSFAIYIRNMKCLDQNQS